MSDTKIPWADVVANPFPGCRKVSEGCENCYAERMAKRLKAMGQPQYSDVVDEHGWTGKVGYNPYALMFSGKGKKVFVQSMGDLFYEGITDDQRDWAFDRMLSQPQHTFQVLTKRPERALAYFEGVRETQATRGEPTPVPAPNIWFGVTAENQARADERIPILLKIPAVVRFVSLEPLLSPVSFHTPFMYEHVFGGSGRLRHMLDWVIVGSESGPKRRECQQYWIVDIVKQCHVAGVPVFVKQINDSGEVVHDPERIAAYLGWRVEDIRQWPASSGLRQRMARCPKISERIF